MVMLRRSLMEGERSCQRVRGGQFNGGRIVPGGVLGEFSMLC